MDLKTYSGNLIMLCQDKMQFGELADGFRCDLNLKQFKEFFGEELPYWAVSVYEVEFYNVGVADSSFYAFKNGDILEHSRIQVK